MGFGALPTTGPFHGLRGRRDAALHLGAGPLPQPAPASSACPARPSARQTFIRGAFLRTSSEQKVDSASQCLLACCRARARAAQPTHGR